MTVATELMWATSPTDAQGQSLLMVPPNICFSSSWIYCYVPFLSHSCYWMWLCNEQCYIWK